MRRLATVMLGVLALGACAGGNGPTPTPPPDLPDAAPVAAQLATGLAGGDVSAVPMTDSAQLADAELDLLMAGMDGLRPKVTVAGIEYRAGDRAATATLNQQLALGTGTWNWQTTAPLAFADGHWEVRWNPSIVAPDLNGTTRLRHRREVPRRAAITGANGKALVEVRTAYRVGIDKANLDKSQWAATATKLAKAVSVDAASYAKQVAAAGAKAFVPAITLREGQVPQAASSLPGVAVLPVELPLAPSSSFAVGILGGSGQAPAETVKASKGDVLPGDPVGTSGLQKRYDAQLRGTVGHTIEVVARNAGTEARTTAAEATGTPAPSDAEDTETPEAETSPSSTASGTQVVKELFSTEAKPGSPLVTTLDLDLQAEAESVLASQRGIASLVVVKVATGEIVAAANSPASGANPDATFGRFAPGSTFKVVTSLALLRKGFTPETRVPCTATVTVNGRAFTNYNDFPSSSVGTITLRQALASSCNTAFIAQWAKLGVDDLAQAAASLGLGVDHDAGYPSFFGSVPPSTNQTTRAANMIGQGQVEASPMAMAGVAASVASGRTTIPWLLPTKKPTPSATPLAPAEAAALQSLMTSVVTDGSGRVLAGQMTGAKTGTAEFGTAKPPKTHAWMIAWNSTHAIAAMVNEGESGSKTAAPIIKAFLALQ